MPYPYPYFNNGGYNSMQQAQVTTFINVPSEEVAYNWNVPPNTTMNFINENQGCFYRKSVGMSILEPFLFEVYEIVKKEANQTQKETNTVTVEQDMSEYITKTEFEDYKSVIEDMKNIIKELKG